MMNGEWWVVVLTVESNCGLRVWDTSGTESGNSGASRPDVR